MHIWSATLCRRKYTEVEKLVSEVEIAVAKIKSCKSPGSDQTPVEVIQVRGETLRSESHKPVNYLEY